jgi:exonuclease III
MNVMGLSSNSKKRLDVFNWAKSKNASIVCFQETHSTKDIETRWEDVLYVSSLLFCTAFQSSQNR